MLGIPLLGWALRLLGHHTEGQADERQLRRELLAHQRRQLIHARIPDAYTAQETFGTRFDELLATHDLPGLGAAHAYYPELTRTVIYQLSKAGSEKQLLQLLKQEHGLWFGPGSIDEAKLQMLVRVVRPWQVSRWAISRVGGLCWSAAARQGDEAGA